eukprot:TRINITY_DN288_c0_g2_i2.p1 TRINITY_DN288_c0_g2~~TRINITY_DN288_c0_g2_i2.p1  ORF type:complete len:196 (+),score=37.89 TRINITY_DN288_c0_g2_i2:82-669(+)
MAPKKILMIVGDYSEDYEVMVPFQMLLLIGHEIHAVCPEKKKDDTIKTAIHDFEGDQTYSEKRGHNFKLNFTFDEVDAEKYDGLLLPGGRGSEYLRNFSKVRDIVAHFVKSNKPIGALCHGPQILAAVPGAMKGKKVTAYPALQFDVENAGGIWEGGCGVAGAITDGNLVTGQAWPGHPAWISQFLKLLGTKIEP